MTAWLVIVQCGSGSKDAAADAGLRRRDTIPAGKTLYPQVHYSHRSDTVPTGQTLHTRFLAPPCSFPPPIPLRHRPRSSLTYPSSHPSPTARSRTDLELGRFRGGPLCRILPRTVPADGAAGCGVAVRRVVPRRAQYRQHVHRRRHNRLWAVWSVARKHMSHAHFHDLLHLHPQALSHPHPAWVCGS